jgi:hypothetical protein
LLALKQRTARPTVVSSLRSISLAVAVSLQDVLGSRLMIKAPNDVLSRCRRKIAGVLVESCTDGRVVLGIGVNVLQDASDRPGDPRGSADSLRLLASSVRRHVAGALIQRLRTMIDGHNVPLIPDRSRRHGRHGVIYIGGMSIRVDSSDHAGGMDATLRSLRHHSGYMSWGFAFQIGTA